MQLPRHLTYDVLDAEGWPTGLSPREKRWALDKIASLLKERGPEGVTLQEARSRLFDEPDPDRKDYPGFIFARVARWEKALCYKILETLETKQLWIPFELRKELEDES